MLFTICTATFNRAHTLTRLYDSLKAQTLTDFEWLIIDDGSVDQTETLVSSLIDVAPFPIRYIFQDNQGKHIAINLGAKLAHGHLFAVADSDDVFLPEALEILADTWNAIPETDKAEFTGATGLCVDDDGIVIGEKFPADIFDSSSIEIFYRHNISGEKWGFHKTEVIRQFPSPSIEGMPFFAEGIIWHRISRQYKTRFINRPLRIYKQDGGEQLTRRTPKQTSPARIFYVCALNEDFDYLFVAPWRFFKIAIQGVRFSLHQSDRLTLQFSRLSRMRLRVLWAFAFFPGCLLFLKDSLAEITRRARS